MERDRTVVRRASRTGLLVNTILILEADSNVTKFICRVLNNYAVLNTTTAVDALRKFREHQQDIALLIADVTSPVLSGIQLSLLLRVENPNLAVILTSAFPVSGWSDQDSADLERLGADSVVVLQKPFDPHSLLHAVSELIGVPQGHEVNSTDG